MNTENRQNYYEILEVSPEATQHEITVAYEKAKKTYSPQNNALYSIFTESEAAALRSLIDEAYSVLSHQSYRHLYEQRLNSKSYSSSDLSLEALKKASEEVYNENKFQNRGNDFDIKIEKPKYDPVPAIEQEIQSCENWDGSFIKKVREYKKLSLESLHEKTKVNPWYLNALENMDPENLPAPVFVRGYIHQMAKTLGLDEKQVTESYMKIYKEKLESLNKKPE